MPASSRVAFANTLRGVAALCVVVFHHGYVFWNLRAVTAQLINAPPLPSPPDVPLYLRWLPYLQPFDLGQFGVGLFFLISGFVIPFSFATTTRRGFAVGRLTRIYPTFMVAFACTALFVWLSSRHFGRAFPHGTATVAWQFLPGFHDMALTPTIDAIIWTLNIEMKFYLVCLLMAPWFARGSVRVFVAPVILTALALFLPTAADTRGFWLIVAIMFIDLMFVGVAFNYFTRGWLSRKGMAIAVAGSCAGMAIPWIHEPVLRPVSAWSYAAALAVFVLAFLLRHSRLFQPTRVTEFFADISYPLYLVHGVIGYVLLRILLDFGWPASLALATTTTSVIGFAWLLHVVLEMPSHAWGKRVASRWRKRADAPALSAAASSAE